MKCLLLLVIYQFLSINCTDIFTSLTHLKDIIENEEILLKTVSDYVTSEEDKINNLERFVELSKEEPIKKSLLSNKTVDEYLSHPLNAYYLIKKYALNLERLAQVGNYNKSLVANFPDETDIAGAAAGIIRLQRTYQLSTNDLANGNIKGFKADPLNSDDCYRLGESSKENSELGLAVQWFNKSIEKLHDGSNNRRIEDIVSLVVDMFLLMGNGKKALDIYSFAIKTAKSDESKEFFQAELDDYNELYKEIDVEENSSIHDEYSWRKTEPEWKVKYEEMCRGQFKQNSKYAKHLRCRYVKSSTCPYEIFKQEILSFSPFISMFHDIISDKEGELLKELAKPTLERAQVGVASKPELTTQRIGKVGWVWDNYDGIGVTKLSNRVARATGLSTTFRHIMTDAEPFQVVNYGVGGQYEPHTDFYLQRSDLNTVPEFLLNTGDRIATWMFYLSTIHAGGATVFPDVEVAVPPIKNAAAFWYNFEEGGDMDMRTSHAGCPILLGQKWVANKWIREFGQFFTRRCPISEFFANEDKYLLSLGYSKREIEEINFYSERPPQPDQ
ncbi:DgyrCDS10411 [Dimorphilus gyrociliatus]|uniref:procollagen-proline 4-dioxygenase n=1 Tax=Dimorphilus gyrociliatus TaxID=2664684 RepID=A0A7I8W039_9ANNE|nr:DgyrCDS10411 [Dimorphilus gyrociliatus]